MEWWNAGPVALMINSLVVLSSYLFGSLGLTIIILTIIIRFAMYPLTVKQLRSTKAMQELQPKIAELQKKYAKDKKRLADEQMKLYRESGVSPAGCGVPMLIQMPIWIALYQSIIRLLAITPEDLLGLSKSLWSWPVVYTMLPLNNSFLWFSLENPDTPLAVLVGVTMWLQQKMVTPNTTDPQQRSQSQLMLWMMPLMFGFLAMSFPSGLALYWVASNVITIIMQYFITGGWGGLSRSSGEGRAVIKASVGGGGGDLKKRIAQAEQSAGITAMEAEIVVSASTPEDEAGSDVSADKLRGVSYPGGAKTIRRQSKRSKGHRSKGR
jgi:YidC/Oxa1 family membrane protein insertase